MNKEKIALTLGALLHDIGKFRQRADYEADQEKTYKQISYEWLTSMYGEGDISACALDHNRHEDMAVDSRQPAVGSWQSAARLIICEAENCAGGKVLSDPGADKGKPWHSEVPLANIFSNIRNPGSDEQEFSSEAFIALKCTDEWIEPGTGENRNSARDYKKLWQRFEQEFNALKKSDNHYNTEAVSHLLEKYGSCIPAIANNESSEQEYERDSDVSLYDHMKITAATALCLNDYHKHIAPDSSYTEILKQETGTDEKQIFVLIGGDISGMQKFTCDMSSKSTLRSLKGRSFFLDLLTEHIADRILQELELSRCNVIFTGGGHFSILAPNTPNTIQGAEKITTQVNDYLFKAFNGAIQQFTETVAFGKNSLKDSSALWAKLLSGLGNAKLCKWKHRTEELLSEPKGPHETCLNDNCHVCGREDEKIEPLSQDEPDTMLCKPCKDQYLLGTQLHAAHDRGNPVICRFEADQGDCVRIGDCYYKIVSLDNENEKEKLFANASGLFHVNDWDLGNFVHPASRALMAGIYLPKDDTDQNSGKGRLAGLRMDADWFGCIFTSPIPGKELAFSKTASLSRHFSLFFKYHLNMLMQGRNNYPERLIIAGKGHERQVSIIYSGGDDLFIIGHCSDITEAAFDIKSAFQRYTGNPCITISAGAVIGNSHEPVCRLAHMAGAAEKSARENKKDSVTLFNTHTFSWKDAYEVANLAKNLAPMAVARDDSPYLPDRSVSEDELRRMLALIREHRKERAWIMPKLAHAFGCLKLGENFAEPWINLKDYVFSENADWHHLEVAILWSLMMMGEE